LRRCVQVDTTINETHSIRIHPETKKRLDALSKRSKRSKSFLAAEVAAQTVGRRVPTRAVGYKGISQLKVLPESFARDPDRLRRFQLEGQAASALNHPKILVAHDIGHPPAVYLVSELLESQSLRERLREGRLAVSKTIDIARQTAAGLAAAQPGTPIVMSAAEAARWTRMGAFHVLTLPDATSLLVAAHSKRAVESAPRGDELEQRRARKKAFRRSRFPARLWIG
jgi:serine/threonine protein kinase